MVVRRKTIMKRRTFLEMGHHASQSPQWGRLRNEDTAIPEIKPFPRGEGGERSEPDRVLAV